MERTEEYRGHVQRASHKARLQAAIRGPFCRPVLVCLILAGCNGEKAPSSAPPSATVNARPGLDAGAILKHKMECRALGVQAEKEQFPEGMNTVKSLNEGLMYFESEFGYNEQLNTCIILSGSQLTDFKTKSVTSYQATLTDLLTNKMLGTYFLLGGQLAPASTSREAFIARVRELLGEPVPRWLAQGPVH
jgi:hypothetical protein